MNEESTLPVWIVKNADGRYLVRKPYDGTWDFTSPTDRFATPLTESMARYFAGFYGGTMVRDTYYVTPANLVSLCHEHHQLRHAGVIHISGNADDEIIVTGDVDRLRFRL